MKGAAGPQMGLQSSSMPPALAPCHHPDRGPLIPRQRESPEWLSDLSLLSEPLPLLVALPYSSLPKILRTLLQRHTSLQMIEQFSSLSE